MLCQYATIQPLQSVLAVFAVEGRFPRAGEQDDEIEVPDSHSGLRDTKA